MEQKERLYVVIGIAMFVYLAGVIIYKWQFATYFSCFSFALIAIGFVLKLKNDWLNLFTITYLIVAVYLISFQMIWIGMHGIYADYTYLNPVPSSSSPPFWIHIVMHGLPIVLVFVVIAEKGTAVNWKRFVVLLCILAAWSYTIDVYRFIHISLFWIAYPLGVPLTIIWLYVYGKVIRPRLKIRQATA